MKAIIVICITGFLFVLTGCDQPASKPSEKSDLALVASNLSYIKDPRTGLCFAVSLSRTAYQYTTASITAVPCDKAQDQLKQEPPITGCGISAC